MKNQVVVIFGRPPNRELGANVAALFTGMHPLQKGLQQNFMGSLADFVACRRSATEERAVGASMIYPI